MLNRLVILCTLLCLSVLSVACSDDSLSSIESPSDSGNNVDVLPADTTVIVDIEEGDTTDDIALPPLEEVNEDNVAPEDTNVEEDTFDPEDISEPEDTMKGEDVELDEGPPPPPDQDNDGILDEDDNCPANPNPEQEDADEDGVGDACDPLTDSDNDGVDDKIDNCPEESNPDQEDLDMDGIGDACDPIIDTDEDGVADDEDNCPYDANPGQSDWNNNGEGDACDPAPDSDGDGIPDPLDPAPEDADSPGIALEQTIYGHTSKKLYTVDVKSYAVTEIGNFKWPADGGGHLMTDIAIDQYGILYGVTFDRLYRCHPQTADCELLGKLLQSFNGLTVVPAGTVEPDKESLIGIANSGSWYQLKVNGGQVTQITLGKYDAGYSSSGDAYSIAGIGTFAAVNKSGTATDYLIQIDPKDGSLIKEIGPISDGNKNYPSVYGLAGWTARAFAFDASGDILVIEIDSANVMKVADTNISWWGAGVRTLP
mgnify:CR=1 FL=1